MKIQPKLFVVPLAVLLVAPPLPGSLSGNVACGQGKTQEGAALGGVAGAIAGGIIGHQNDETPEGAIIGGVVGAVAGGLIGNAKDDQIRREHAYRSQVAHQQQQLAARAVTIADAIHMTRSGLSDSLIINHIRTNGVQRHLETRDIITLHENGVSEPVISTMQRVATGGVQVVEAAPVAPPPPPVVVVRKQYRVVPRYVPGPSIHIHHRGYPYRAARRYRHRRHW